MKKLLVLSSVALLALAVGCSDETTRKVTYTNQAGETVEFELKASEDKEMVKKALDYASQADYTKLDGLQIKGDASFDLGYEVSEYNAMRTNGSGSFDARLSDEGFSLSASGKFTEEQTMQVSSSMSQDVSKQTVKTSGDAAISVYYSVDDSKFLYGDLSMEATSYLNGDKTTSANQSEKAKMDASNYGLEEIFNGTTTGLDLVIGYVQQFSSSFSATSVDEMLAILKEFSANSNLVVSSVTKNTFTVQAQISVKDVVALVMAEIVGSTGVANINLSGIEDTFVNLNFKFDVASGLFAGISLSADLKSYLNKAVETIYSSVGSTSITVETPEITAAKVEFDVSVSYSGVSIKKLTDSQKNGYTYVPSSPLDYTM